MLVVWVVVGTRSKAVMMNSVTWVSPSFDVGDWVLSDYDTRLPVMMPVT